MYFKQYLWQNTPYFMARIVLDFLKQWYIIACKSINKFTFDINYEKSYIYKSIRTNHKSCIHS